MGRHRPGIQIEPTEAEVNCLTEALAIAEASGLPLELLDATVDALGPSITDSMNHCIDDPLNAALDHPGDLLDGFQA